MSDEMDKTNTSVSKNIRDSNFEDDCESAVNSASIELAEIGLGLHEEPENEDRYISDYPSDTPSEKEHKAEEQARRDELDYEEALQEKMQWDGTYHPKVDGNDLVQYTNDKKLVSQDWFKDDNTQFTNCTHRWQIKELCHNCGWTSSDQTSPEGYSSRLKIRHLRAHSGLWEAGPKWFIRDEINNDWNGPGNDYKAQQFIRQNVPEVPLVKEMHRFGDEDDKYALTVMSRAKGIGLEDIRNKLTQKQRDILSEDLAKYVLQWRKFTAPRMQTVDGKQIRDFIFKCDHGPCADIPFDTIQWLDRLAPAWRKALFSRKFHKYAPEEVKPKGRFPDSWVKEVDEKVARMRTVLLNEGRLSKQEFVFTHGDLNIGNIFVFEETPGVFKISAIIDWEFAGYCPWWVEILSDISGLFRPEQMPLLLSSEDFEAYFRIAKEIGGAVWELQTQGENLFKHFPNDHNNWYGRPFCKCEPFCRLYRSDDAFALKASREVTYSVNENYPDHWTEFHMMWNSLIESERPKGE